ncbi:GMC oxidoreductase, partial [Zasmidium cellare ATCC 36951]
NFGVPDLNATYDYVIVGGGTAGLAIAGRLAEDPSKTIAVVEAGSFYEITNGNLSQIPGDDIYFAGKSPQDYNHLVDWGFVTTPQAGANGQVIHYARDKTFGGCSARNFLGYQRGTRASYQMWADQVDDQSYTFDNILPYFKKSLHFTPPNQSPGYRAANSTPQYDESSLGQGGPLQIGFPNYAQAISSWFQKALDIIGVHPINGLTSGELIGSAYCLDTLDPATSERTTSYTAFLRPALERRQQNFYVYPNTLAHRIVFNGTKAQGVVVSSQGGEYTLTAAEEVILSAGVFQSPQLLMRSGVGPCHDLESLGIDCVVDLPRVGQNMWDHILFGPSYQVNVDTASIVARPGYIFKANEQYTANGTGILSSPGADFLAWEKVPTFLRQNVSQQAIADLATFPDDWPELEYISVGAYFGDSQNFVTGGPKDQALGKNYATLAMGLVAPLSRGNVSINSSDPASPPLINPNWFTHPTDQEVGIAAYKRARAAFTAEPMIQNNITIGQEYFPGTNVSSDADILEQIKNTFTLLYHAAGTCKMGTVDDSMAVVDSQARVYGLQNLRVVDSSAFPFLPPGHPQATVYMLAEKIADDIHQQRGCV